MAKIKPIPDKKDTNGRRSILSISYDESLLHTREWILKAEGFHVTSACGFTEGHECARRGGYDLAIVGHSIPDRDKVALIAEFRKYSKAPVLSMIKYGDALLPHADHSLQAFEGPEAFVKAVRKALGDQGIAAAEG